MSISGNVARTSDVCAPMKGRSIAVIVAVSAAGGLLAAAAFMDRSSPVVAPGPSVATGMTASPSGSQDVQPLNELAAFAWWDTQQVDFGVIPEAPQPDPPPASPGGYRQLRVGTLDGRVTAVRTLPSTWSGSYVSGPVDGEVLVVVDDGATSIVSTITAETGGEAVLFESDAIVPAAALSPGGDEIWYVKLDRRNGADMGLWRRARTGARDEQVVPGALGEPFDEVGITVWHVMVEPRGRAVAVQWCFGEVRCRTHVLNVGTGDVASTVEIGWPRGFTDTELVARGLRDGSVVALDLATLESQTWPAVDFEGGWPVRTAGTWWMVGSQGVGDVTRALRLVPGADPEALDRHPGDELSGFRVPYDAGVAPLPDGWALRWPVAWPIWPGDGKTDSSGRLINVTTGAQIELPPFLPDLRDPDCEVVAPRETPAGLLAGPARFELREGVRHVRWSQGPDAVTLAVGTPVIGTPTELIDGVPVVVRGQEGRAVLIGDDAVGEAALVWQEDGCTYTAWLAPGTPLEAAVEYAAAY